MIMQMPTSLTATVHIGFNYAGAKAGAIRGGEVKILDRLLNRAAELDPALQELLVKFVDHMDKVAPEGNGDRQSPG